jgi:hypothetical protein
MAGNMESELREAMADQVSDISAPRSLADTVIRRHRRRVIRTRLIVTASVAVVAAAGGLPAYRALSPALPDDPAEPGVVAVSATPLPSPGSTSPAPGPGGAPRSEASNSVPGGVGGSGSDHRSSRRQAGIDFRYLPAGLRPGGCDTGEVAGRRTTTCRWTGGSALDRTWVEVRVVRGTGISRAADLDFPAPRTEAAKVAGEPAVVGFRPDGSRQVVWTVRRGVGVFVAAGGSVRDDLLGIANGVKIS